VGAITCGSLFLIFAVFLGTVLWLLRPHLSDIWASGQLSAACVRNLHAIHGALDRYRTARGVSPARLTDLLPTYLSRRGTLRCPADRVAAGPTSYRYAPPIPGKRGASVTAPVVTCDHHQLVIMGQRAVNVLQLMPDGKIKQETFILPETKPARGPVRGAGSTGG
jgi:hypothetical protein